MIETYYDVLARTHGSINNDLWFADQNALYVCSHLAETKGLTSFSKFNTGRTFFGCYYSETRDQFTRRRLQELGIPLELGRWLGVA
jgi:hypothetical protein